VYPPHVALDPTNKKKKYYDNISNVLLKKGRKTTEERKISGGGNKKKNFDGTRGALGRGADQSERAKKEGASALQRV